MPLTTAKAASLPQRDTARRAVRTRSDEAVVPGAMPVVLTRVTRHLPVSTPHTWTRRNVRCCVLEKLVWVSGCRNGALEELEPEGASLRLEQGYHS